MGIELERLLKMDEHHLHELFGTETDNESTGSAEYKYLQEHIPEYIKRLKSRGTTDRKSTRLNSSHPSSSRMPSSA